MYQILSSDNAGTLCFEVNSFLQSHKNYKLWGGPYSDGTFHYQAVVEISIIKQLND